MRNVIGQERAIGVLRAAMAGRMHHAWVLHGPVGVGKFTTAMGVARELLCHDPQATLTGEREACGACASCKLFAKPQAAHPDLHVVQKEMAATSDVAKLRAAKQMNIPIDLLRELVVGGMAGNDKFYDPQVAKTPALQHGKVFIIDEAELLDQYGQNALLKTLEEPPAGTYIFLVTAHEDRLLPTILSRCQRVGFAALSDEQHAAWLSKRDEVASMSAAQREGIVRFACGSPGRALLAAAYGLDEWHRTLGPMVAQAAAGKADPSLGAAMAERCEAFAKAWVEGHDGASKDAANKAAMRLMLSMLGEVCRASMRRLAEAGLRPDDPGAADAALGPWLAGIELLNDAEAEMNANVAPPLLLDNLAIQWTEAGAAARLQPA